ncbi:MAG: hypothetical protein R3C15_01855 [Thermoleophilia bacterium]
MQDGDTSGTSLGASTYPAAIYTGSCDSVDEMAFPLEEIGTGSGTTTTGDAATGEQTGMSGTSGFEATSRTTVAATVDRLTGGGYVVGVGDPEGEGDGFLACGPILPAGETLFVQLRAQGDSGQYGNATLTRVDDGSTRVELLVHGGTGEPQPARPPGDVLRPRRGRLPARGRRVHRQVDERQVDDRGRRVARRTGPGRLRRQRPPLGRADRRLRRVRRHRRAGRDDPARD